MLSNIFFKKGKNFHTEAGYLGFPPPSLQANKNFKGPYVLQGEARKAESWGEQEREGLKEVSLQIFKAAEGKFPVAFFMFVIELLV